MQGTSNNSVLLVIPAKNGIQQLQVIDYPVHWISTSLE